MPCALLSPDSPGYGSLTHLSFHSCNSHLCFPGGSDGKESACSAGGTGDAGSIPPSGRSPGEGNGNPLQYSCLGNPMDRGVWWAPVHGVTRLSAQAPLISSTQPDLEPEAVIQNSLCPEKPTPERWGSSSGKKDGQRLWAASCIQHQGCRL